MRAHPAVSLRPPQQQGIGSALHRSPFAAQRQRCTDPQPQPLAISNRAACNPQQSVSGLVMPSLLQPSRRAMLLASVTLTSTAQQLRASKPAHASLVRFPASELQNSYYLIAAGTSNAEEQNITVTNPVWKTGGMCGLSQSGAQQVVRQTLPQLKALRGCEDGCWLWPSMTQSSYQTAEILASLLGMGRDRIVPEYSFLDKRGLGALEDLPFDKVRVQVAQGDSQDAGWKPRPGTDGTPNESVKDVFVRVRQMLSITETQYTGQDVLIISPDSYVLSVLQAAVLGVDLTQHEVFAMGPGQVKPLQLSNTSFDASPRRFSCPDPPRCSQMSSDPWAPSGPVQLLP